MQQRKSSSLTLSINTDVELIASVSHQLRFTLCVVHWRPRNGFFGTEVLKIWCFHLQLHTSKWSNKTNILNASSGFKVHVTVIMAGKCNINIGACTPACTEELPIPSVAVNKLFDLCPLPIKDAAFHTSKHTNLANTLAGQEAGTGNSGKNRK